jgi:hypothetical protein
MITCTSCHAVCLVGRDTLELTGKSATLAASTGALRLGVTGEYEGASFVVQGRVRYSYDQGFWDEWCLQFSNSKLGWVSEDDGELTITQNRKTSITPIRFSKLKVGQSIVSGDSNYRVQESGTAVSLGGEGQLPFVVLPRETIEYKTLRAGTNRLATLELSDEGVKLFSGRKIKEAELNIIEPVVPLPPPAGPTDNHPVASATLEKMGCFCCAAPLEVKDGALVLTCTYCGTLNDRDLPQVDCPACKAHFGLAFATNIEQAHCPTCHSVLKVTSPDRPKILVRAEKEGSTNKNDGDKTTTVDPAQFRAPSIRPFRIGQRCTIQGIEYVLTGHLRSVVYEADIPYPSDSFILMSKSNGHLWLEKEDNHFVLNRRMNEAPSVGPGKSRKSKVPIGDATYKVFEKGLSKTTWVQGQFPYIAKAGDESSYTDLINPPYSICIEESNNELEAFKGKYLQPSEVAAAFDFDEAQLSKPNGVAPSQPFIRSPFRRYSKKVQGYSALIMLLCFIVSNGKGQHVDKMTIEPKEYSGGQEYQSQYFEITQSDTLVELEAFAPVDNSWVYLDMMLIDAAENRIHEFSTNISYYHGYEGGESWSEGSRQREIYLKIKDPGQYKLVVTGETPNNKDWWDKQGHVDIVIQEGVWLSRYPLAVFLFSLIWFFGEIIAKASFSAVRWGNDA